MSVQLVLSASTHVPSVSVRHRGRYLACESVVDECTEDVVNLSDELLGRVVELTINGGLPRNGLLLIECKLGALLSGERPLLVVDDAAVAEEVSSLLAEVDEDLRDGMGKSGFDELLSDLGCWLDYIDAMDMRPTAATGTATAISADVATAAAMPAHQPVGSDHSTQQTVPVAPLAVQHPEFPEASSHAQCLSSTQQSGAGLGADPAGPAPTPYLAAGSSDLSSQLQQLYRTDAYKQHVLEVCTSLLHFAVCRGFVATANAVLSDMLALGTSFADILTACTQADLQFQEHAGAAADSNGKPLSLLAHATASGSGEMVVAVLDWGVKYNHPWSWQDVELACNVTEPVAVACFSSPLTKFDGVGGGVGGKSCCEEQAEEFECCSGGSQLHERATSRIGKAAVSLVHASSQPQPAAAAVDNSEGMHARVLRQFAAACEIWQPTAEARSVLIGRLSACASSEALMDEGGLPGDSQLACTPSSIIVGSGAGTGNLAVSDQPSPPKTPRAHQQLQRMRANGDNAEPRPCRKRSILECLQAVLAVSSSAPVPNPAIPVTAVEAVNAAAPLTENAATETAFGLLIPADGVPQSLAKAQRAWAAEFTPALASPLTAVPRIWYHPAMTMCEPMLHSAASAPSLCTQIASASNGPGISFVGTTRRSGSPSAAAAAASAFPFTAVQRTASAFVRGVAAVAGGSAAASSYVNGGVAGAGVAVSAAAAASGDDNMDVRGMLCMEAVISACQAVLSGNHYRRVLDETVCKGQVLAGAPFGYPCHAQPTLQLGWLAARPLQLLTGCVRLTDLRYEGARPGEVWFQSGTLMLILMVLATYFAPRFYVRHLRMPILITLLLGPKALPLLTQVLFPHHPPSLFFGMYMPAEAALILWNSAVYHMTRTAGYWLALAHMVLGAAICLFVPLGDLGVEAHWGSILLQIVCAAAASVVLRRCQEAWRSSSACKAWAAKKAL